MCKVHHIVKLLIHQLIDVQRRVIAIHRILQRAGQIKYLKPAPRVMPACRVADQCHDILSNPIIHKSKIPDHRGIINHPFNRHRTMLQHLFTRRTANHPAVWCRKKIVLHQIALVVMLHVGPVMQIRTQHPAA